MPQQVLYVDPAQGNDSRDGRSSNQPLKTLTAALRLSQGDTIVQLQAGLYTTNSGEQFPLVLPEGCQVIGQMNGDRPGTMLQGSGSLQNAALGAKSVTCVVRSGAALKNVTITNTQTQGVGIWLEAGRPVLEKVFAIKCPDAGAVVLGKAMPTLQDCVLQECGTGLVFLTQSKGQIERVLCLKNRVGMRVQDTAAPLISACRFEQNTTGLEITGTANPVLRGNRITGNQSVGLSLTGTGTADMGLAADPGQNVVRNNGQTDIKNDTGRSLLSCGNDVLPQRVAGSVSLIASTLPDPAAIPSLLLDQPADFPPSVPPPPVGAAAPETTPTPAPRGSVRFSDMANHWAGPFVDGLAQAGAVAGFKDGTFQPQKAVTRAEFAAFILASFPDQPEKNAAARYADVPRDFWGYEALTKAQRMGFLSGYPDGTMRPNEPITRIQAIVAVTNGLGLTGGRVDDIGLYRDRAQVPSYAVDALSTATQRRLVVNHPEPTVLRPLEPISRGEVSALIYQGRVAQGKSGAIASPYIVQPDTAQPLFTDLSGHWAAAFVRGLAEAKLISGLEDGSFAPDAPMSRAQFAALVVNAFQPTPKREAATFKDVPPNYWAAQAIQAACQGEFMSGFPDQTFAPEHPMLRVQVWVALVNGLTWHNPEINLNPLGQFEDYTTLPKYALQQTAIALEKHLIANHPERQRLRPNQVATRAEVCVAVYQALVALQRLPAIASDYVV